MLENLVGEEEGKKLLRRKPYEQDLAMIRQAVTDLLFLGSDAPDNVEEEGGGEGDGNPEEDEAAGYHAW